MAKIKELSGKSAKHKAPEVVLIFSFFFPLSEPGPDTPGAARGAQEAQENSGRRSRTSRGPEDKESRKERRPRPRSLGPKPAIAEPDKPSGEALHPGACSAAMIPRLSRLDKEVITRVGTALFVTLLKMISWKHGTILSLVQIHLIEAVGADSLHQMITSGDSFLPVIFHSA